MQTTDFFQKKLQKVSEMVEQTLATVPETRNDDMFLTTQIWRIYYKEASKLDPDTNRLMYDEEVIPYLPREDHIKRIRAKIQNEERRYLPTNKNVLILRAKASVEWKQFLGYNAYWNDEAWDKAIEAYLVEYKNPKLF